MIKIRTVTKPNGGKKEGRKIIEMWKWKEKAEKKKKEKGKVSEEIWSSQRCQSSLCMTDQLWLATPSNQ